MKGKQIPLSALSARIFAVVDVWDALNSNRPYRAAWPEEKIREHIRSLTGIHFQVVLEKGYLTAEQLDGILDVRAMTEGGIKG